MKKFFYPLVKDPYRNKDIQAAIKVVKSHKLNAGNQTIKFQNMFKKKIKVNNAIMVNSGSSANLLALQCIINPYRNKRLKRGDEVLIPSLCWSTSLWPIIQSGLKPKFIDIDKSTLNLDLNDLESKISKKTKAILIVHVLGNTTNMDRLMKIKKKYNLILIEDTCESLGTKYGNKYLGTFGEISTFSFYASHQISSGEGGMVCCSSTEDAEIIKALRAHGWSRGLKNENKIANQNKHLDRKFIFYNSGFNLRSTDIAASIGISQFKDLDKFITVRGKNRLKILKEVSKNKKINKKINIIKENEKVKASWFGLPITLSRSIDKKLFIKKIEKKGIETRPIISGNFLKQPALKKYKLISKIKMKNADFVNNQGFFIGLPTKNISSNIVKKLVKVFEQSV